jgi:hypothetical protein
MRDGHKSLDVDLSSDLVGIALDLMPQQPDEQRSRHGSVEEADQHTHQHERLCGGEILQAKPSDQVDKGPPNHREGCNCRQEEVAPAPHTQRPAPWTRLRSTSH